MSELYAFLALEGDVLSYVPLKFPNNQQEKALIDTGACANVFCKRDYEELKSSSATTASLSQPFEVSKVKQASGQLIPVRGKIQLDFCTAKKPFQGTVFSSSKHEKHHFGRSIFQKELHWTLPEIEHD